jgi:hypothetical protein
VGSSSFTNEKPPKTGADRPWDTTGYVILRREARGDVLAWGVVCEACDFSSPCACERKRLARPPLEAPLADATDLHTDLEAALNVIATLLHEVEPNLGVATEAEALLARLRAR